MARRPTAPRSLPELAAAMIQLSADERPELQAVRKELALLLEARTRQESPAAPIPTQIAQAIAQLDALLAGAPDAATLLITATDLVCQTTSSEAPPPIAEPV